MARVLVVQADNRPTLPYLLKSQAVNRRWCEKMGFQYAYYPIDERVPNRLHPANKKIELVLQLLQEVRDIDYLVFLDSDAWIQNGFWLQQALDKFLTPHADKWGIFSRDPYCHFNTYVNSGSFVLKVNEATRNMYKEVLVALNADPAHHHIPNDQVYISHFVWCHRQHFVVFVPDVCNTPNGSILRHNWWKNRKMYRDMDMLLHAKNFLSSPMPAAETLIDHAPFPNVGLDNEYK